MRWVPAQHLRTAVPLALVLFALSVSICGQTPSAPTSGLKDAAKEPLQKGLAAAHQQDWKLAIRYFLEAQKADPDAPQIWFNLGLASSKLPGYELRALAWFRAYLLAVPDAPNADAIRQQIATLEVTFESRTSKIIDGLEAVPRVRAAAGTSVPELDRRDYLIQGALDIGVRLAASRIFLGNTEDGLKTLQATTGLDSNEISRLEEKDCAPSASAAGRSWNLPVNLMVGSLVAGDRFPSDNDLVIHCAIIPSTAYYVMESGDFDLARRIVDYHNSAENLKESSGYSEKIACFALDLNKSEAFTMNFLNVDLLHIKIPDFDHDGHRVHLAELEIAAHHYRDARAYAFDEEWEAKDRIPRDLLGVLVAVGENERANALAKRFGLGDLVNAYASGSLKLPDPCLDAANWWGRSRKSYLANLALEGLKIARLSRAGDATSDFGDETEFFNLLRQSQDILGGSDPVASVKAAQRIAEDVFRLAEEYRRVHGPYGHLPKTCPDPTVRCR